jgi:hypothetical protein
MRVNQQSFFFCNFDKMKTILRISAIISLFVMISMAGFSQGTCGMKFNPYSPPSPSDSPWTAFYHIYDITLGIYAESSSGISVSPTQENDYTFLALSLPYPSHNYRFFVTVTDNNGHQGSGGSASFTGAQYNLGGTNFKENVNVIDLN